MGRINLHKADVLAYKLTVPGVPAGGILVDLECRRYLTKLLANANLDPQDVEEYVGAGVQDFEQTTKKEFDSPEVTHYISFCNSRLTLSQLRIRRGRMVLDR